MNRQLTLDELHAHIDGSNDFGVLKAPMIEKGILKRAGKGLGEVSEQVARKKSEAGLSSLLKLSKRSPGC